MLPGSLEHGGAGWPRGAPAAGSQACEAGASGAGKQRSPVLDQVTLARTEGQLFRERVGFLILCVIGAFCMMRILVELKSILEPFLWAIFLVMAWKPVVDGLERRIDRLLAAFGRWMRSEKRHTGPGIVTEEDPHGELQSMLEDQDGASDVDPAEVAPAGSLDSPGPLRARRPMEGPALRVSCKDVDSDDEFAWEDGSNTWRRTCARSLAVLMATAGMLGLLTGFGFLILESARHMRDNWDVYRKGAEKLTKESQVFWAMIPASMLKQYQDVSADMVKTAQDVLYGLLGDFVNNASSLLLGGLMTLLYTIFWLCSPVPMDSSIDKMFRKYIMFKTLACFGYGVCVGLLLAFLSIDLASFFALTTFALNYVPEVGPFLAMVLPFPVIIFDSRLDRPFLVLLASVLGQLALKFAFSNIIEVKLIESDKKLRMHPVMILLSVGVFGHLWGPTGMLLSVPLMALLKISLFSESVPSSYRDPILIILEGDRNAPSKHGLQHAAPAAVRRRGRNGPPPGG